MFRVIFYLLTSLLIISCTNKTTYSGKIINQDNFKDINFENKDILIQKLGYPSFIDPIENKFFYFSEKSKKTNLLQNKIDYSYVFVFSFDDSDEISKSEVYNLNNKKEIELVNEETSNSVIRRGLLEKIFGGVGTQQELPTSP